MSTSGLFPQKISLKFQDDSKYHSAHSCAAVGQVEKGEMLRKAAGGAEERVLGGQVVAHLIGQVWLVGIKPILALGATKNN